MRIGSITPYTYNYTLKTTQNKNSVVQYQSLPSNEINFRALFWGGKRSKDVTESESTALKKQKPANLTDTENYIYELNSLYQSNSSLAKRKPFEFSPPRTNEYAENQYNELKRSGRDVQEMFGNIAQRRNDSYDAVLLDLIKSPKLDVNKKYDRGYNVSCNPLFILVTLNKPYLLQEALKKRDANPNMICGGSETLSPVSRAIDSNSLDCVYVLLKSGKVTRSELQRAITISKVSPEMKKLLDSYPNVEDYVKKQFEATENALKKDIKTLDDVMITPNVDLNFVDSNGNSILHIIDSIDDKQKAMQFLLTALKRKVKINQTNNKGLTPIQTYLQSGKYELVTAMIDNGADLSVFKDSLQNSFGHIVCSLADEENAKKLLDYAIDKGLNLDEKNCTGTTIIANAVKTRKYSLLNYLINKGASLNIQDNNGMTPLHFACILNDQNSLEIIMNSFPNTQIQDKTGKIASDYLTQPELIQYYNMFKSII